MIRPEKNDLEKLSRNITLIKELLANSRPSLRLLFLPVHFRVQALAFGLCVTALSLAYYLVEQVYGTFSATPALYRCLFYGGIAAAWIFLAILKMTNWAGSLSKIDSRYSFGRAAREMMSLGVISFALPFWITIFFFIAYWPITGSPYMIIPTLCIGTGLHFHFIGSITGIKNYVITGTWILLWGFAVIVIGTIPGPFAVTGSFGAGTILFSLLSFICNKREQAP